jgi:hypothetical protein
MRAVYLIILAILVKSCNTIVIDKPPEYQIYSPIIDSGGRLHDYKTSIDWMLFNDYGLYCIRHYRWETISVRYAKKDSVNQMPKTVYIVRRSWPN